MNSLHNAYSRNTAKYELLHKYERGRMNMQKKQKHSTSMNSINSLTHSLSVNTVCSTMDLIRAALRLSDHTLTSFSIPSFSISQMSGMRGEKKSDNPPAEVHHTGMENAISKPSVTRI